MATTVSYLSDSDNGATLNLTFNDAGDFEFAIQQKKGSLRPSPDEIVVFKQASENSEEYQKAAKALLTFFRVLLPDGR